MNTVAATKNGLYAMPAPGEEFRYHLLSIFFGVVFSLGIFLGIAHHEKSASGEPMVQIEDLRVASVSTPLPPPLPVTPVEPPQESVPMAGFSLSPSSSPVKIAVSPPDLNSILPEELSRAPQPNVSLSPLMSEFKPKMKIEFNTQHIFQKAEVDRLPSVVTRSTSNMSQHNAGGVNTLRVTLLLVVNIDGTTTGIRVAESSGDKGFDARAITDINEWVFSPALKGGRKVRCMIQQSLTVQFSGGSRFTN